MAHQSWLRTMSGWLIRHKADLFQFGWPFALFEIFNWLFEGGFFPIALWVWGPVWGAIIPTATALALNIFIFWMYDRMKIDWLQAHAVRELANKKNKNTLEELITWHFVPRTTLRERFIGEIRFALLLIPIDPVIVAVYYREKHFEGVSNRDWLVLAKATLVACIVWLLVIDPFVTAAKYVWYTIL